MKIALNLFATILLITLSCKVTLAQNKKQTPDLSALIGLEIVDGKYPDGWKEVDALPTGLPEIKRQGDVIRLGSTYALVSKKYLTIYSKTYPNRFVIVDVKPTKYNYDKKHSTQTNCKHPTVMDTDKVRLFAFSRFSEADYCRVKTRNILEAWTINFETGEFKKIDHEGMSCNINYYLSGEGPKCKKIEGLKNAN